MSLSPSSNIDTGVHALVTIAQLHQLAIDPAGVIHQYAVPGEVLSDQELLRAAKAFGFRSRLITSSLENLSNSALPAIAKTHDGEYFVLAKVSNPQSLGGNIEGIGRGAQSEALILQVSERAPQKVSKEQLDEIWSGELILLTKRQRLLESVREFDISWFIPSLLKYKKLFTDVVIASFFLQLFALITPLFFQVVMDKVLVHKGLTTLYVLAVGFFVVAIFDALLSGIRTYVFSHTTNRVDVELGSKLFSHLMGLPLAYFESRQVGQTVARVRELDTIRNFITGTALTLCIDIFFTIIFFIVMWWYSPTLTLVVLGTIPFYIALSLVITPILRRRLDEKFKYGAENQAFLVESINGVETVKASAVEPQMQRRWENQLANYVNASFKTQHVGNISGQIAGFINKITTLLIIFLGAYAVMAGDMTVGQLVAFNMIAGRVSSPILKLVQLWQDFQQAGISVARLGDILNTPREVASRATRSTLPTFSGAVTFEHIKFRYRLDGPIVLDDVSLQAKPGEIIGIVGRSG